MFSKVLYTVSWYTSSTPLLALANRETQISKAPNNGTVRSSKDMMGAERQNKVSTCSYNDVLSDLSGDISYVCALQINGDFVDLLYRPRVEERAESVAAKPLKG